MSEIHVPMRNRSESIVDVALNCRVLSGEDGDVAREVAFRTAYRRHKHGLASQMIRGGNLSSGSALPALAPTPAG